VDKRRCHCGHSPEVHRNGPGNTSCIVCDCEGFDEIQNPVSVGAACVLIGIATGALITLIVGWPLGIFVGVPAALVLARLIFEGIIPDQEHETCRACGIRAGLPHEGWCRFSTKYVERGQIDGE
jgi:hypothetical protein